MTFKENIEHIVNTDFSSEKETLIDILLKTKQSNKNKKMQGRRYNENLKKFCLYLYLTGGKYTYENLNKNFEGSLPSLSLVKSLLVATEPYSESFVRIEHLYKYMEKRKYDLFVWISEDQTKIVEQITYSSKSNRLMGFVYSLDTNGFPEENTFLATSAYAIKKHFDSGIRASYVNIVMAQPLHNKSSAFCIAAYASNNKFTFDDVNNRWEFIKLKCSGYNINALGFSSDGDPRNLKAMRVSSELGLEVLSNNEPWFHVSN